MRDTWHERISEYLDGELRGEDLVAFEERLGHDAELARAVEEVRQIVARAREMESPVPPEVVWEGIAARIGAVPGAGDSQRAGFGPGSDPRGSVRASRPRSPAPHRGVQLRWSQILAACLALVMVSVVGGWWLRSATLHGPGGDRAAGPETGRLGTPIAEGGSGADASPAGEGGDLAGDTGLALAIAELEDELRSRGDQLDEETRVILEDNLILIDQAIRDARQALALDPGSEYLTAHLNESMLRKARLLERATRLVSKEI